MMKHLNYYIFSTIAWLAWVGFTPTAGAQVSFSGNALEVYDEIPAKNTGLNHVFVLHDAQGVAMHYTASSDQTVVWLRFGAQGGGYAEEIADISRNGRETTLAQVVANQGYIIEEGTQRTYVWVIDYQSHFLQISDIAVAENDCNTLTLNFNAQGAEIPFYTITGSRKTLGRDMALDYQNLVWSDDETRWVQVDTTEILDYVQNVLVMPSPLCNTQFTLSGDRFLKFWGIPQPSASCELSQVKAVDVRCVVEQEKRDNDNEKGSLDDALGGSAPVKITFKGYPTDAVAHSEWQMATDAEFENIEMRLNQNEIEQTFEEAGTTYWRYIAASDEGSCEAIGETYTVNVGESELVCPNIFSPGSTEGVNDVWKVSYKSIIEFKCSIFNAWGNEICHFNDPSQGWDGKYKGKLVSPGVYYYVIQARGSDGKHYKLSGDINIIRYKRNVGTGTSVVE